MMAECLQLQSANPKLQIKNDASYHDMYYPGSNQIRPRLQTAGALQGDSTARSLLTQIRDLVGANSGASSVFGRLTDIGMDIKVDGTISVNSTELTSAMGNLTELKKFFSNSDVNNSGNNGMSQRIAGMTKQAGP